MTKKQAPNTHLSRRDLMKLVSAGLAVSAAPELTACQPQGDTPAEDATAAKATWFELGRRDDLVRLKLGLVGFELRDAESSPPPDGLVLKGSLYLGRTSGPGYVLVDHPPQHLFEEAFIEPVSGPPPVGTAPSVGQVVNHRLARASRLSFFVPEALLAIPFELEAILATLSTLQLYVASNAYDEPLSGVALPSFGPSGAPLTSLGGAMRVKAALRSARTRQRTLSYQSNNPEVNSGAAPVGEPRGFAEVPAPPSHLRTQIEMPYRLIISPNRHATWEHATRPVTSKLGAVELWHTSMTAPQGWMKTIRALDVRESGFAPYQPRKVLPDNPFRSSLTSQDRADLVHLTTNFTLNDSAGHQVTRAVDVNRLMLSSLGGWLDAHGAWALSTLGPSLASWAHQASMGRDHKVEVANYGYLYPFGHLAVWVRVTERKFLPGWEDTGFLWSHSFIVVKEPLKTYAGAATPLGRAFPFTSVRFKTLITPNLDASAPLAKVPSMTRSKWALRGGNPFPFEVEAIDHDGNSHAFTTACIWLEAIEVAEQFPPKGAVDVLVAQEWAAGGGGGWRVSPMKSQRIALAPSDTLDDTSHSIRSVANTAISVGGLVPFAPQLDVAEVAIDAARALTGADVSASFKYAKAYVDNGFDALDAVSPKNLAGVYMGLANPLDEAAKLIVSKASDKVGGFISPDLVISGLSRAQGLVAGDPTALLGSVPNFDPDAFFKSLGAKLFGVLPLSALIDKVGGASALKQAPRFVTQALDTAELVFHTFENAGHLVDDLKQRLVNEFKQALDALSGFVDPKTLTDAQQLIYERLKARAGALGLLPSQLQAEAAALGSAVDAVAAAVLSLAKNLEKVASLGSATDVSALVDQLILDLSAARAALDTLGKTLRTLVLPIDDGLKTKLLSVYERIVVKLLPSASDFDAFKTVLRAFVKGEEALRNLHLTLDWSPTISGFPSGNEIFWPNDKNGFRLGVDVRGKSAGGEPAGASVFASLTDFELRLIGKNDFLKLVFDRLVFKTGTDGKATIDVGFRGVHFGGPLSFIETIRRFIPLDGFSDPPAVNVSPQGLSASYSLPLPNVAVGVFSLENLSVSAGFEIPFVGKSLAVSFAFCSREAPFSLTVCMLGGGGFVGLTLTPDGVRKLEAALEAQACLSVDFGVASGSVSMALGIYFGYESDDCKLTGYLRIRGVVHVLGIVHASIELNLDLTYEDSTGKVVGRASLEIEVSVFCFHKSVTIETERKFSGSNSDPTFRQAMSYDLPSGFAPWDEYCDAFSLVAS